MRSRAGGYQLYRATPAGTAATPQNDIREIAQEIIKNSQKWSFGNGKRTEITAARASTAQGGG